MRIVIQIVLWIIIVGLGYLLFNSVYGEVKFNELKEVRYQKAIDKLIDIRDSQLAYKQVTGKFAKNFNDLERFIDTAEFTITQRRDSVVLDEERTKAFGVDMTKEIILVDTLGTKSVKDSLFGNTGRYKTMMNVPGTDAKFEMDAGTIMSNDIRIPVFEAKVAKELLLQDQPKDFVNKEKQVVSVDGVNGAYIIIGSMTDVKTVGNWPKSYGGNEDN
ncbi:hypothetical protein [Flavimarina sp. Hel_I_48]|uniref:hypothetical protein n=1 Tax=Flavimarina sp. Hel_I_48 TaxID=1392488 RepID=UPI0004DF529D|nr:hypothetical protein [Flavimarina sp. Hel_I_48]